MNRMKNYAKKGFCFVFFLKMTNLDIFYLELLTFSD